MRGYIAFRIINSYPIKKQNLNDLIFMPINFIPCLNDSLYLVFD